MADNVTITQGANSTPPNGTVVATDQVGGYHYQRVKFVLGADGSVDGDVNDALPMPTEEQEVAPTDASKNNASYALSYTGDNLTQVDMTIGGVTYRKTLGYTGSNLTSVSAWAVV